MPTTFVIEPAGRLSAMPVTLSIALIAVCMTKKAIAPANAATSFSFFAIPIATPIANRIGRLAKIISPHLFKTVKIAYMKVPSPNIDVNP